MGDGTYVSLTPFHTGKDWAGKWPDTHTHTHLMLESYVRFCSVEYRINRHTTFLMFWRNPSINMEHWRHLHVLTWFSLLFLASSCFWSQPFLHCVSEDNDQPSVWCGWVQILQKAANDNLVQILLPLAVDANRVVWFPVLLFCLQWRKNSTYALLFNPWFWAGVACNNFYESSASLMIVGVFIQ